MSTSETSPSEEIQVQSTLTTCCLMKSLFHNYAIKNQATSMAIINLPGSNLEENSLGGMGVQKILPTDKLSRTVCVRPSDGKLSVDLFTSYICRQVEMQLSVNVVSFAHQLFCARISNHLPNGRF
uniref:SJCHGC03522 protein n=1 Tax=Schistosoma japonicum TaxID=6182 RepID=Q5DHD6_SCHJA|nr:SJCHGC03522 protein [Schistosoma japonicum]